MTSQLFADFYRSFLESPYDPREGLNEEALLGLDDAEKETAERLLLERLTARDSRCSQGLGLRGSKKASQRLKSLLPQATGEILVHCALALWRIERFPGAVANIVRVLKEGHHLDRVQAVVFLRFIDSEESKRVLWSSLEDGDPVVRCNASDSLLRMHGHVWKPYSGHPISDRLLSKDTNERQKAIGDLRSLIGDL